MPCRPLGKMGPPRARGILSRGQPPWPLMAEHPELTGTCGLGRSRKTQALVQTEGQKPTRRRWPGHAGVGACWGQGGGAAGEGGAPSQPASQTPRSKASRWVPPTNHCTPRPTVPAFARTSLSENHPREGNTQERTETEKAQPRGDQGFPSWGGLPAGAATTATVT